MGVLTGKQPWRRLTNTHTATSPHAALPQYSSARYVCGVQEATDGTRVWTYNSSGFYQQDTYTGTIRSKNLPTNVVQTSGAKVVADDTTMWLCAYNSSNTVFEVHSAPLVTGTTQPTWTGPLQSMATNGTLIPTAFSRGASGNLYLGEYTGGSDITGGPSVYRSTNDGATWGTVLGPLATTRHIHGVYEDPFNPTHVYVTVGDTGSPDYVYRSIDSGATFTAVETLGAGGLAYWQAVAVGFTQEWVWFFSDQFNGGGVYVCDRDTLTPRVATITRHDHIAVPGASGGRTVADLATTNGDATVTSASAAFVAADVGRYLRGPNTINDGSYITTINSGTSVEISQNATGTGTNQTASVTSDTFYGNAYAGAIDPTTGWAYIVANDASVGGNIGGIFVLTEPGAGLHLWKVLGPGNPTASLEVFIRGGYLWVQRYGPLATFTEV